MIKLCQVLLLLAALAGAACTTRHSVIEPPAEYSQAGEFGASDSLVYAPPLMAQLRHIVDSVSYRHQACGPPPALRTLRQGRGQYVYLEKTNLKQALRALQQGISPEQFAARFHPTRVQNNELVFTSEDRWKGPKGQLQARTIYTGFSIGESGSWTLFAPGFEQAQRPEKGRWVIQYMLEPTYPTLEAVYFPEGLTQQVLPPQGARLVQYADCLIDTAQIFARNAGYGLRYSKSVPKAEAAFMKFAHQQTLRPWFDYESTETEAETKCHQRARKEWDSLRLQRMDRLAKTPQFKALLAHAVADTATMGATSEEFEEYVARYCSPWKALEYKRSRQVMGSCSRDTSPRRHALAIARLSAETLNWSIFLRAHLDILNDRFERISDGGYAQARRQTYLRELEELHLNVPDLMIGIALGVANAPAHHYNGSVGRIGRALAETRQPRAVERQLLALVTDPTLDA